MNTFKSCNELGIEAFAFTSDYRLLISASGSTLQIWDMESKRCIAVMNDIHDGKV